MAVTIVLEGQALMEFAEALKAEFPEFEVSFETVGTVRGRLEDVQKVVINVGLGC